MDEHTNYILDQGLVAKCCMRLVLTLVDYANVGSTDYHKVVGLMMPAFDIMYSNLTKENREVIDEWIRGTAKLPLKSKSREAEHNV